MATKSKYSSSRRRVSLSRSSESRYVRVNGTRPGIVGVPRNSSAKVYSRVSFVWALVRKWKRCVCTALRCCARCIFTSTSDIGMQKSTGIVMITCVRSTRKIEYAAFSKSVSWISIGRNSTRQPTCAPCGGGLNRIVCQFVDWIFSKWSIERASSKSMFSENTTSGSRTKRCAICSARSSSTPHSISRCLTGMFISRSTSFHSRAFRYESTES